MSLDPNLDAVPTYLLRYVPPAATSIPNGRPQVLRHWYYLIHPSRLPRLYDGEQCVDRYLLHIQTQYVPCLLSHRFHSNEQCISLSLVGPEADAGRHQKSRRKGTCLAARFDSDPKLIILSAVGHSESHFLPVSRFLLPAPREDALEGRCDLGHSSSFLNCAACLPCFRYLPTSGCYCVA